jgi:Cu(I)/Ag(I) efflux system membrane fusion protein
MALARKSAMKEAGTEELTALRRVSLSPTQRVLANVSVLRVMKARLLKDIVTSGTVEVPESRQATISARFRGRIERLFVSYTGQRVSADDPLFTLYSPDIASAQQDYLLALNGAQLSASQQFSGNSGHLVNSARERLRTHYGMTDQKLKELESSGNARSTMTFHAPVPGTVLQKSVTEGQYVDEGTVLYQLADLSQVWVYLTIYEQDLRFAHEGMEVELISDAFPGRTFPGRVTFVDPVLDPETRSVRLRVESRNTDHRLKPGMFMRGRISTLLEPTLVIPTTAVLFTGTRDVVWVETNTNTFEPREITKGMETAEMTQVLSGLHEGESVVVTGGYLIDSESSLQTTGAHSPKNSQTTSRPTEGPVNNLFLLVKGSYTPDVLRAARNVPIRLAVYRAEKSACTEEIVFPDFGVRSALSAFDTTIVTFVADRAGTFKFSCGMDMVHGTLVVE